MQKNPILSAGDYALSSNVPKSEFDNTDIVKFDVGFFMKSANLYTGKNERV
jgi:hypothetical protein